MAIDLSLSALLSQVLVAFTIEFDNDAEQRVQHVTTVSRQSGEIGRGLWLVSLAMWANCIRLLSDEGVSVAELSRLAKTTPHFVGLERWRYIVVEPDPADSRPKPSRSDWIVRPTSAGREAQEIWRPLAGEIEQRWRERFGTGEIDRLRALLEPLVSQAGLDLPDFLPTLGYGLWTRSPNAKQAVTTVDNAGAIAELPLYALISRVLMAFAIEFERESPLSLAMSANVLRVLDEHGVPIRNLPLVTGVSKEAVNVSVGFLQRNAYVIVETDPTGNRGKSVRLTPKGKRAQNTYRRSLDEIEVRWQERFGSDTVQALRVALESIVDGSPSRLSQGLTPSSTGWRMRKPYITQTKAMIANPSRALPQYPMVSHRGGYPDGS